MKTSKNGINLIKEFEAFKSKPYLDIVGIPTIGYGTTFIDGKPVTMQTPAIDEKTASKYLEIHILETEKLIKKYVKIQLTQNQYDALVSFAYNVGNGAFKSSTLLRKLNQNDLMGASREFNRWVNAGGKPSKGLINRRLLEQELFLKGE